jgi:flagellar biosynthesis protein FlhF
MKPPYKYFAPTIEEATAQIHGSLGPDAMIVSTQRIQGKGGRLFFEISAVPGNEKGDPAPGPPPDALNEIKDELVRLQEMMTVMNTPPGLSLPHLLAHPALMPVCSRMIRQGIETGVIGKILEKAGLLDDPLHLTPREAARRVARAIEQMLPVDDPFASDTRQQKIAAVVGTTGVGKTTTIAKMAANLIMGHRKSVGLISIDTYRIGAREQLKNYADILGVPCFQAFTPRDLGLALGRLQSRDVVLIDTAGQSQYDMARLEGLKTMIGKESSIDVHLLLNVGAAPSEMNETVRRFNPLFFKTYIFTKLDETRMMGNIINQVVKYPRPVSFVTAGQNVPEDIEMADEMKLSALMLKNRDETAVTIGE